MADRKRRRPTAMAAAAQLLEASTLNEPTIDGWQREAWQLYDAEGALYFAAQWMGNALSRVRLFAARRPERPGDEPDPLDGGPAVDLVAAIGGGVSGTAQIMKSLGVHLTVPGIGYLVTETDDEDTDWQVYSAEEIRAKTLGNGGRKLWQVRTGEKESDWRSLPPDYLVTEIRRPHERYHWRPDSPARHALKDLWEAQKASDHIEASLTSRLTGNGLFVYPSEADFPAPADMPEGYDAWAFQVMSVAEVAIKNRASPAARIPLFSQMSGDLIEKCKLFMFDTPLDAKVVELRSDAIRRAATAMDMPAEVLLGMGDINHWGQWFIEESALKLNVVPNAELIVHGITKGYLQPALDGADDDAVVWFDLSELTVKPDKSANSILAYDRLEISGEAIRRDLGLTEGDAPDDDELADMVGKKLIASPLTAPLGLALTGLSGEDIPVITGGPETTVAPPEGDRSEEPPEMGEPAPGPNGSEAVVAAAYPIVKRALEVAGNRLRNKLPTQMRDQLKDRTDCPPESLHTCVDIATGPLGVLSLTAGAWASVPEVAQHLGWDATGMATVLEEYTAQLLEAGEPLTWSGLREALSHA